jgi:outer membrane biosynthesis protein TonB
VPSPELGTSIAEESPALKRRRRREVASPAQQQQPAKKPRGRPPARPQPPRQPSPEPSPQPQRRPQAQTQAKAKPTAKKRQPKKKKKPADDEDAEAPSGSVPVTVQRFTKPARASAAADGEDEASTDLLNGEIPFSSRGGVNAVDVLSKLCEELIEAYMDRLEERGRAAEDAATRREQKTMYRTLEAFQEELRTRLLEHVSVAVLKFWLFGGG